MRHTLYPAPVSTEYREGNFPFHGELDLYICPETFHQDQIQMLCRLWFQFCSESCVLNILTDPTLPKNALRVAEGSAISERVEENAYRLSVSENGVTIVGFGTRELLYGFYTLLQMIKTVDTDPGRESFYLDCCDIFDKPAVAFRAIIFCVHPYTSLTMLQKQVRLAAMMKFTHLILEFWGSLKLDALKELSWKNGFTKDQIRPIIEDAISMGMEIIPMFNHLGHASGSELLSCKHVVLDQNPRLSPLFENSGWSFCVSNPKTRELLRKIRQELVELCGPGRYFHIGMDEAHDFGFCDRCSQYEPGQLLADFVNEIRDEMAGQGRRVLMWADMLLPKAEFGQYDVRENGVRHLLVANGKEEHPTHKALPLLKKDILLVDWQYYYLGKWPLLTTEYLEKHGFDVISASYNNLDNVKLLAAQTDQDDHFGYMSTLWQTIVKYPELIVFSGEAAWFGRKAESIDSFRHEVRFYDTANLQRRLLPRCSDYDDAGLMGELESKTQFC